MFSVHVYDEISGHKIYQETSLLTEKLKVNLILENTYILTFYLCLLHILREANDM